MIEINNLTASKVDEEFLKGVAKKVLKGEDRKEVGLSIVFIGEARMRKLNKRYRGKNKVTDVLSFGDELNEIVICLREIKKNVKTYNSTFKKELARVLIHAILHLLGYEHGEKMEEKQEFYLNLLKC